MKLTTHHQTIIVGIIVAVLAFYGGMQYQKGKASTNGGNYNRGGMMQGLNGGSYTGSGAGGGRTGGRMANGGFASGDILSKDDKSVTIKLRNGGSQIVLFSDKTQVVKSDQGALTDLAVGQSLTITGTSNPDGSLTADSIQIRPARPATTDQTAPAAAKVN